jgi:hypothetical protein
MPIRPPAAGTRPSPELLMNQPLRDRIDRKLETLSDERLYQVLDYVEFLESKYAARQAPAANVFQRFAENVEDRLRAGRVSAATIAETMSLMNKAMGVLNGVAAAGKSVASDLVNAATPSPRPPAPGTGEPDAATASPAQPSPRSSGESTS